MDASSSSSKSSVKKAAAMSTGALVQESAKSHHPKALSPQVLSSLPPDEVPMKPVFVKRENRENSTSACSKPIESTKRSLNTASGCSLSKKPLCSFEDE
jgi:hypothetical protein